MKIEDKTILTLPHQQFFKSEDFSNSLIENQKFLYNGFEFCNFNNVTFKNCSVVFCNFTENFASDLQFINCDLSGLSYYSPKKDYQISFDNCDLSGTVFSEQSQFFILKNCFVFKTGYKVEGERIEII